MNRTHKRVLAFVWEKFGPYHMDRCESCAQHFGTDVEIVGIEVASHGGDTYQWEPTGRGERFRKVTLFPGMSRKDVSPWRHYCAVLSACLRSGARHVFICGFEQAPIFFAALCLRALGRKVIVMQDSKFDDKPRRLLKEWIKAMAYAPYHAAAVGSPRSRDYLAFLGMPHSRIFVGYDTVSVDRLRRLAESPPAPDGLSHAERHFTVIARFVAQKNLRLVLDAYALYRSQHPGQPRELHLCGSGVLEEELRDRVLRQRLQGIVFRGSLPEQGIAKTLASSLALILPSVEEPFGLVVNEALALAVPVIVSENCGARDLLVRQSINGYVIEPDNAEGLARLMAELDMNRETWSRLSRGAVQFQGAADTRTFARTVESVIRHLSPRSIPLGSPP